MSNIITPNDLKGCDMQGGYISSIEVYSSEHPHTQAKPLRVYNYEPWKAHNFIFRQTLNAYLSAQRGNGPVNVDVNTWGGLDPNFIAVGTGTRPSDETTGPYLEAMALPSQYSDRWLTSDLPPYAQSWDNRNGGSVDIPNGDFICLAASDGTSANPGDYRVSQEAVWITAENTNANNLTITEVGQTDYINWTNNLAWRVVLPTPIVMRPTEYFRIKYKWFIRLPSYEVYTFQNQFPTIERPGGFNGRAVYAHRWPQHAKSLIDAQYLAALQADSTYDDLPDVPGGVGRIPYGVRGLARNGRYIGMQYHAPNLTYRDGFHNFANILTYDDNSIIDLDSQYCFAPPMYANNWYSRLRQPAFYCDYSTTHPLVIPNNPSTSFAPSGGYQHGTNVYGRYWNDVPAEWGGQSPQTTFFLWIPIMDNWTQSVYNNGTSQVYAKRYRGNTNAGVNGMNRFIIANNIFFCGYHFELDKTDAGAPFKLQEDQELEWGAQFTWGIQNII